jgi:FtsP/CotA-like multicopper oxidase with cupredoxin domain
VTQCAIGPWENYTYAFDAYPAGTHWYHSHNGIQSAKGIVGALIVHAKNDPYKDMYDEEQIVTIQDMRQIPEFSMFGGSQFANYVDSEIERGMWNGQWGDGSDEYPYPLVKVKPDTRYRLRFINMANVAQVFNVTITGHTMTVIAYDGYDVEPQEVNSFTLLMGERADVILHTKPASEAGNYLMEADYTLCSGDSPLDSLETSFNWKLEQFGVPPRIKWPFDDGDKIAIPDMGIVESCSHYAYISYEGHDEVPRDLTGTGGGKNAVVPPATVEVPSLDMESESGYELLKPRVKPNEALSVDKADFEYTMLLSYKQETEQFWMTDRETHKPWKHADTPLLHTKGECGADETPLVTIPPGARTVDVIINNLTPSAHVLHLHGTQFRVIGWASYRDDSFNAWHGNPENKCPLENQMLADLDNEFLGPDRQIGSRFTGGLWWGCAYNDEMDRDSLDLEEPIEKDMIMIMRRSWAKIRFEVTNPGVWLMHCHVLTHMMDSMEVAFNFLPDEQPPLPDKVRQCGPCEIWNRAEEAEALKAIASGHMLEEDDDDQGHNVVLSEFQLAGALVGTATLGAVFAMGMMALAKKKQNAKHNAGESGFQPLTQDDW